MATKTKKSVTVDPQRPGYYVSPLEQYPGYLQFPVPLEYPHYKDWWIKTIQPLKEINKFDFARIDLEWEGAKLLLLEWGTWGLSNISPGKVKANQVPIEVVNFVREAADDYLYDLISPKDLRLLFMST